LEKIAALKRLGLSLDEIAAVIDLYFQDGTGIMAKEKVLAILEGQLAKTNAKLQEMTVFSGDLIANISRMKQLIAVARGE
ncbi:MAG: MerR family DNA-binding protein, partial [Desulfopila sp.]